MMLCVGARSPSNCLECRVNPRRMYADMPPILLDVLTMRCYFFLVSLRSFASQTIQGGPISELEWRAGFDRYPAASHVCAGGAKSGAGGCREHRHRAADAPGLHGGSAGNRAKSIVFLFLNNDKTTATTGTSAIPANRSSFQATTVCDCKPQMPDQR